MQSNPDLLSTLSANPWFGSLPLRERRSMLAASERMRVQPGEMLFRQGDRVPAGRGMFYGLLSGRFKISSLREDGKEAILAVLEAGNWFGEVSLLDQLPRTHDATALVSSEVLLLGRASFDALMQRHAFAHAVCRMLAARTRSLYGMVEDATLRSVRARVARRLVLLARGDATQAPDARPVVPVSQESLAMMLGVTRQTLSKELRVLAAAGAIASRYGRIEIVSIAALERLVTDTVGAA